MSDLNYTIVEVTRDAVSKYPQVICFINPKHPTHSLKVDWILAQFDRGMKIKLLFLDGVKKPVGYVEYLPGEQCWRGVNARGYLFIHCLWTNGKQYQHQGLGQALLAACEADAREQAMSGVCVMTSDKAFMASRELFMKHGYRQVDQMASEQLLVKSFRDDGPHPSLKDPKQSLSTYPQEGLVVVYSRQCPWVARFIQEMTPVLNAYQLSADITELKTPEAAQKAPTVYGVFALIYNGKVLSDRYISVTRFKNILKKEMLIPADA